jgi:hypothetical protein
MNAADQSPASPAHVALLESVRQRAVASGQFGACAIEREGVTTRLSCEAKDAGDAAFYRAWVGLDGRAWVSLVTPARYLSQSIEQDLVHSGDKAGDLLRDELIDLGAMAGRDGAPPVVEHFRDEHKLYTFRTPLEPGADAKRVGDYLLAYAACFGHLGDMQGGED